MARLRLFAGVKEVAGVGEIEVDVSTVGGLVAEADGRFGSEFIKARAGANLFLNGETQIDDLATPIGRKDEVSIIPPVSGGTDGTNGLSESDASARTRSTTRPTRRKAAKR